MKCKHCGQEIKKQTNFDKLKACRDKEDVDKYIEKFCQTKGCPLRKICAEQAEEDGRCTMTILNEWLFKQDGAIKRRTA